MIYLASPYSHDDVNVRARRFDTTFHFTNTLLRQGIACFSPIVYGHQFSVCFNAPIDAKTWAPFNNRMLRMCDEVWVLCIEGWRESLGVQAEISLAAALNINISYASIENPEQFNSLNKAQSDAHH